MVSSAAARTSLMSLADMPAAWLQGLPGAIKRCARADLAADDLLALFRTCRMLRDVVLSQRRLWLSFLLPIPSEAAAATQAKLQLACKYSLDIELRFWFRSDDAGHLAGDVDASAASLMFGASGIKELVGIKEVALYGLPLGGLMPHWINYTCPSLRELQLDGCQYSGLPRPSTSIPSCTALKQLCLCEPLSIDQQHTFEQWKCQLRSLRGLESITFDAVNGPWHDGDLEDQPLVTPCLECAASAVGGQLTRLEFPDPGPDASIPPQLPAWFPQIRDLNLCNRTVTDADMEVLLSMHSCHSLSCYGIQLQHSHTHRPTPWTQFALRRVDMASFTRLSLEGVQLVQSTGHSWDDDKACIQPSPDLAVTTAAAAAIRRCGGLPWKADIESIELDSGEGEGHAGFSCVAATLPLLATCKADEFTLTGAVEVGPQWLAASLPTVSTIHFGGCTFSPALWPLLLPRLPAAVKCVGLFWHPLTEAQITEMCVHASRPVKVDGHFHSLQPGWKERVQAAMAAAGHQLVQLAS